jgi:hypothetical protein
LIGRLSGTETASAIGGCSETNGLRAVTPLAEGNRFKPLDPPVARVCPSIRSNALVGLQHAVVRFCPLDGI